VKIDQIHKEANNQVFLLAQKYLQSKSEAERICGNWLEYELIYDYKQNDAQLRPIVPLKEAMNKLTKEERKNFIDDIGNWCKNLEKNLIKLERKEKRFLKVFTGDDKKDIQSVYDVIFSESRESAKISKKRRRKLKIKSEPWNKLPDTVAPDEIFVEIITNTGKKIGKKVISGWIDENGDKLECKIIKWRKNENYKSYDI
jgi:hypothetical protein